MVNMLNATGVVPENYIPLASQIAQNTQDKPHSAAIVSVDTGESISWTDLSTWTVRIGHFLESIGIYANHRIVVLGQNSLEHLILYYGIQAFGATYCAINTETNANHLREMLTRIQPTLILWHEDLDRDAIGYSKVAQWISFNNRNVDTGLFAVLSKFEPNNPHKTNHHQEDSCVLCFTSGTSAQPKGVIHSFSNYQAIAQHQLQRWSLTANDRILEFRSISWASVSYTHLTLPTNREV